MYLRYQRYYQRAARADRDCLDTAAILYMLTNRHHQYLWIYPLAFHWLYAKLHCTADILPPIKAVCAHFILATGAASAPQGVLGIVWEYLKPFLMQLEVVVSNKYATHRCTKECNPKQMKDSKVLWNFLM